MPHVELKAIDRKIRDTRAESQNIAQRSDENMRKIMTSELEYRLSDLERQKAEIEEAYSKESVSLRIYGHRN